MHLHGLVRLDYAPFWLAAALGFEWMRDALHGGATTAVDVLEVEERSVPEGLFDLADPTARQRLESAP